MEGGDAAALPRSRQSLVRPLKNLPVQLSVRDVPSFR